MNNLVFNLSNITVPMREPQTIIVHQISIFEIILYFVIYLGIHITLGVFKEKEEKIKSDDKEHLDRLKFLKHAFKWWPFVYLLLIILTKI